MSTAVPTALGEGAATIKVNLKKSGYANRQFSGTRVEPVILQGLSFVDAKTLAVLTFRPEKDKKPPSQPILHAVVLDAQHGRIIGQREIAVHLHERWA